MQTEFLTEEPNQETETKKRGRKKKEAMQETTDATDNFELKQPSTGDVTDYVKVTENPVLNKTIPVTQSTRDSRGYLRNIEYPRKQDGRVDWRALIPKEYLVVHREHFERINKPVPESIEGLKDNQILVLLAGIKFLAGLRGYTELRFPTIVSSPDHCTVECVIKWIPCEDSDYRVDTSAGVGDATPSNTNSFARFYLGPIAENRAFVRCVRNYLGINVLGKDEIGEIKKDKQEEISENNKYVAEKVRNDLKKLMEEKGVLFEHIKKKLISEDYKDAGNFNSVDDIPVPKVLSLVERIKKMKTTESS